MLAAWCVTHSTTPHEVRGDAARRDAFRQHLAAGGFELSWPE
jgi:hypothetical protein